MDQDMPDAAAPGELPGEFNQPFGNDDWSREYKVTEGRMLACSVHRNGLSPITL